MSKNKLLYPILVILFLFCGFTASAQEETITGVVKGVDDGIPIPSANIVLKNDPSVGTATDFDGNFGIKASSGDVMVISAIGMKTIEVSVTSESTYKVDMELDIAELGQVVITGFDNVEKRLFTGANSSISAEELKVDGVVDVSRMLEGKAAGVNVQNVTGTFGAAPKITIRGSSSIFGDNKPLFVIDGVVQEDVINLSFDELTSGDATTLIGSSIAGLNANDIKNIEILKDASATALYGARALNGVVVINTKSGKRETPTTVTYTMENTIRDIPNYSTYDILDSQKTMGVLQELEGKGWLNQSDLAQSRYGGVYYGMTQAMNNFVGPGYSSDFSSNGFEVTNLPEYRNKYLQQYEYANTDWFKELFKPSMTQNHSLSFTGGGKNNGYYASVSFYDDPGQTIADKVQRLTTNFKNTFYFSDKFNLTLSNKTSIRKQNAPGTYASSENVVSGVVSRDFDINPFSYALNTNRTLRPYDNNGDYEYSLSNWTPFNIVDELNNNHLELNVQDILFQIQAKYDFADHLSYDLTASGRYVNSSNEHFVTEDANAANVYRSMGTTLIRDANIYLYSDPEDPTAKPISVLPNGGLYYRTDNTLESYYLRNTVSYKNKFDNKHDLNVLLGQDLRYVDRDQTNFTGYGLQYGKGYTANTDPQIIEKTINQGDQYFGKTQERERTVSAFGKATYAYDNRYVFSATGRYDGSNRQGNSTSSRWLPTYSVSGKWNITRESFMDNVDFISNLQFRPSYGLTATSGPATNSLAIFKSNIIYRKLVSQRENELTIDALQNSELTWEKQYETNFGLDLGLFKNRVELSTDVYFRSGFDLVDYVKTSGIGGESVKLANNADMTTNGIEFSLHTKNIKTDNFSWNTTLNFSRFTQEITKLQSEPNVLDLVDLTGGNIVGYPRNSLFSLDFKGLNDKGLPTFNLPEGSDPVTGVNFQDTENITDYLKYEGSVEPNTSAGFSNNFNYKNWSLNLFMTSSWGNKIRLNPIYNSDGQGNVYFSDLDVFTKDFKNRWILPGDENSTNIPVIADKRLTAQNANLGRAYNAYNYSTERVADGGFVRMKNISLSYSFPDSFTDKLGINSFSLKLLTTNPFLIYSDSALNGQDPEFFLSGGVAYPIMRQYTITLNLSI